MSSDFEFARIFDPSLPAPPVHLPPPPLTATGPPPSDPPPPPPSTWPDSWPRRLLVQSLSRFNTLPKVLHLSDRLFRDAPPVGLALRDHVWTIQGDLKVTSAQQFILDKLLGALRSEIGPRRMRQLENLVSVLDLAYLVADEDVEEGRWKKLQLTDFDASRTSKSSLHDLGRLVDQFLPEDHRACFSVKAEVVEQSGSHPARVFFRVTKVAAEVKAEIGGGGDEDKEERSRRRLVEAQPLYLLYIAHEPFFFSDRIDPDSVVCGALCGSLQCTGYLPYIPLALPSCDSTQHLDEILKGCLQKQQERLQRTESEMDNSKESKQPIEDKVLKEPKISQVIDDRDCPAVHLLQDLKDECSENLTSHETEYPQALNHHTLQQAQYCDNWQGANPANQLLLLKPEMPLILQDCLASLERLAEKEGEENLKLVKMENVNCLGVVEENVAEDLGRVDFKVDCMSVQVKAEAKAKGKARRRKNINALVPPQHARRFQCSWCYQSYSRRWNLKHHIDKVHKTDDSATLIALGYERQTQLKQQNGGRTTEHVAPQYSESQSLTGNNTKGRPIKFSRKKSFVCGGECGYVSSSVWNLKVHRDTVHLKRKNYSCSQCTYASANSSNVKKHERTMHVHQQQQQQQAMEGSGKKRRRRKAKENGVAESGVRNDALPIIL